MITKKDVNAVSLVRITQARKTMGFSLSEAANLLGFNNYQTLSAIEKGARNINAHELSNMAKIYGRDLIYFFQHDISNDPKPLWRKSTDAIDKKIEREFLHFLENYSNLEHLLGLRRKWNSIQRNLDRSDFAGGGFKLAGELANDIWNQLDLGSRPAFNLLNVLENDLRFKILHLQLENGISGASVCDDALGVGILINAKEAPWRRNFDLAHELFHIVTWHSFTHDEVGDGRIDTKPEQYANEFASSLLLPKQHFTSAVEEKVNDARIKIVDIIELAKDFGVSTQAVLWRLVNLGICKKTAVDEALDEPEFQRMNKQMRYGLYSKELPSKFPSRYISLACRCLIEGRISRGTFAIYLEIDRSDVDNYLKRHGFIEENYEKIAFD